MKNQEIERLRAIAVIMTTVAHGMFASLLPTYMLFCFTGVDVFFVISGFVVTQSLLRLLPTFDPTDTFLLRWHKAHIAIKTFYIKRAFRILPLATLWLLIHLLLSYYFKDTKGTNLGMPEVIFKEIIAVFSGVYNYVVSYGVTGNVSHYWSLAVEEQFYLFLPFFFILFISFKSRVKSAFYLSIFLLACIPFINIFLRTNFLRYIFEQRYFALLFGVILSLFYKPMPRRINSVFFINYFRAKAVSSANRILGFSTSLKTHLFIPVFGILYFPYYVFIKNFKTSVSLLLILVIWALPGITNETFRYGFSYVVIAILATVLVSLASHESGWILEIPIVKELLSYIGSRSYGIYLSHLAFVRLHDTLLFIYNYQIPAWLKNSQKGVFLQWTAVWIVMIVVSEITYRFLEKPMIDLGKAYIKENIGSDNQST